MKITFHRQPDHGHSQAGRGRDTRLKELEDENPPLKKMYADERLKSEIIQEAMAKKW